MRKYGRVFPELNSLETSAKPGKSYTKEYSKFIGSTITELRRNHSVIVFTEEQLNALRNHFGDNLEVKLNPTGDFYTCCLITKGGKDND